jgi:hypothetical protein
LTGIWRKSKRRKSKLLVLSGRRLFPFLSSLFCAFILTGGHGGWQQGKGDRFGYLRGRKASGARTQAKSRVVAVVLAILQHYHVSEYLLIIFRSASLRAAVGGTIKAARRKAYSACGSRKTAIDNDHTQLLRRLQWHWLTPPGLSCFIYLWC